jgi:hypothetical protein
LIDADVKNIAAGKTSGDMKRIFLYYFFAAIAA